MNPPRWGGRVRGEQFLGGLAICFVVGMALGAGIHTTRCEEARTVQAYQTSLRELDTRLGVVEAIVASDHPTITEAAKTLPELQRKLSRIEKKLSPRVLRRLDR